MSKAALQWVVQLRPLLIAQSSSERRLAVVRRDDRLDAWAAQRALLIFAFASMPRPSGGGCPGGGGPRHLLPRSAGGHLRSGRLVTCRRPR